jgi:hypothetical protein
MPQYNIPRANRSVRRPSLGPPRRSARRSSFHAYIRFTDPCVGPSRFYRSLAIFPRLTIPTSSPATRCVTFHRPDQSKIIPSMSVVERWRRGRVALLLAGQHCSCSRFELRAAAHRVSNSEWRYASSGQSSSYRRGPAKVRASYPSAEIPAGQSVRTVAACAWSQDHGHFPRSAPDWSGRTRRSPRLSVAALLLSVLAGPALRSSSSSSKL